MGILASRFLPLWYVPWISRISWGGRAGSISTVPLTHEEPSRDQYTHHELMGNITDSALIGATPFCLSLIAAPSGGGIDVAGPSRSMFFDELDLMRLDGGFSE